MARGYDRDVAASRGRKAADVATRPDRRRQRAQPEACARRAACGWVADDRGVERRRGDRARGRDAPRRDPHGFASPRHERHGGRAPPRRRRADGRDTGGRDQLASVRQRQLGARRRVRRVPREAVHHPRVPRAGSRLLQQRRVVNAPAALSHRLDVGIHVARFPIVLPSIRDPRLHLAAVIVSLQVLGQVAFDFRVSIAQILISLGTCAVLELAIVFRRERVLAWPASALLTGNGVAFVLRVPGTEHGDWWSLRGAWIYAATAAVALLSKYVIRVRRRHVFNPSNLGLVVCFLALGPGRADPLDFWWGPMSASLALALAIIVAGGVVILSRLRLLELALSFWVAFVLAVGVVAATGHAMSAKWHFGPITGLHFWTVLATSPEILVFLFFMLTDPKTVPTGRGARVAFAVSVALLAALLIAPTRTEFWAKVAVLGALAIACAARPVLAAAAPAVRPQRLVALAAAGLLACVGALVAGGLHARPAPTAVRPGVAAEQLPRIAIASSHGVDRMLDRRTAVAIVSDLQRRRLPISDVRRITLWLESRTGQVAVAVARLEGRRIVTVEVGQSLRGYRVARIRPS